MDATDARSEDGLLQQIRVYGIEHDRSEAPISTTQSSFSQLTIGKVTKSVAPYRCSLFCSTPSYLNPRLVHSASNPG